MIKRYSTRSLPFFLGHQKLQDNQGKYIPKCPFEERPETQTIFVCGRTWEEKVAVIKKKLRKKFKFKQILKGQLGASVTVQHCQSPRQNGSLHPLNISFSRVSTRFSLWKTSGLARELRKSPWGTQAKTWPVSVIFSQMHHELPEPDMEGLQKLYSLHHT